VGRLVVFARKCTDLVYGRQRRMQILQGGLECNGGGIQTTTAAETPNLYAHYAMECTIAFRLHTS
jgi:hypothetical protein